MERWSKFCTTWDSCCTNVTCMRNFKPRKRAKNSFMFYQEFIHIYKRWFSHCFQNEPQDTATANVSNEGSSQSRESSGTPATTKTSRFDEFMRKLAHRKEAPSQTQNDTDNTWFASALTLLFFFHINFNITITSVHLTQLVMTCLRVYTSCNKDVFSQISKLGCFNVGNLTRLLNTA